MALAVGTDTYATLAEYQAYAAAFGWSLTGEDADDEVNLRLGRRALDLSYIWKGDKSDDAQPLAFPRDDEATPQAIKDAQCELAYIIQGGADPMAALSGGAVKREKVDVIETEYERPRERDAYPAVDALVSGLHNGKAGNGFGSVNLVRG
jgi:hypothetical protein